MAVVSVTLINLFNDLEMSSAAEEGSGSDVGHTSSPRSSEIGITLASLGITLFTFTITMLGVSEVLSSLRAAATRVSAVVGHGRSVATSCASTGPCTLPSRLEKPDSDALLEYATQE